MRLTLRRLVYLLFAWLALAAVGRAEEHADLPPTHSVEPELYATGFEFAEGPALNAAGDLFVVNYRLGGTIGRIAADGTAGIFCDLRETAPLEERRSKANGLKVDGEGRLIVADSGVGRVLRVSADGKRVEVLADRCNGRRFNSINDVALDRDGNIYFSDPGGSSVKNPIGSVYRYDIQTAKVTQLATGLAFPNGVAVAPGGKQFCVGESERYRILIFDLTPEGKLTNRRVLIDFPTETRGPIIGGATPPDGMIFDAAGRLYVAMYTGGVINVVEVPSGKLLRQYKAGGERATNCHFRKGYLYVTVAAKEAVFRLKLGVEGYDYAGTSGPALGQQKKPYPTIGTIQRLDPRFDKLIPRDAVLEKLAEGFEWTEGPVWVPKGGLLLFSDIPNNSVMKWKEGEGVSLFLKPSGYTGKEERGGEPGSNGLLLDAQGQLVLCQHGDRRLARLKRDGPFATLADRYQGKRLNSPNDAVFRSNGDLYFTDPPYGLAKGPDDPARELDFCGVYRLSADGRLTLLTDKLTRPNGIGFSPDEKTLYVAQSDPERAVWMAFEVKDDGTLGGQRVFYDATRVVKAGKLKGLPDGLKVDQAGNLFAAGPGGVNVFSPDGTLLGRIDPGEATANCCFGEDGSVLYLTADMYLCRIKTNTKGRGF